MHDPGSAPAARVGGEDGGRLTSESFADRFESVKGVLWHVAAGVLGSRSGAEDVVQESAALALSKLDEYTPGTNFKAWMAAIVRYVALNEARKRQRARQKQIETAGFPAESMNASDSNPTGLNPDRAATSDADLFDDELLSALQTLSDTARTCLLLRTLQDMPYRDIATMLDIAEGTAMSHVHRGRAALRARLAARFSADGRLRRVE
ncbi:MAG: RNA polymerase sigma factor [Planctomycetota bacterium]|nr:RNA polymerase sigma factor [Planctomycetota bacterium]